MPYPDWDNPVPPPARTRPEPVKVDQTVEAGDVVVMRGMYLAPEMIVLDDGGSIGRATCHWFDRDYRLQVAHFPIQDLVVRRKHTEIDQRTVQ